MTSTTPHLDRNGLEVLGATECLELLGSTPIGRIAFVHDGDPTIMPVAHVVSHGGIAFRSAAGSKLDHAIMGRPVAFEVDGLDPDRRTGWSVLATGVADVVDDAEVEAELEARGVVPWAPHVTWGSWIHVRVDELSGRRIPG